MGANSAQPVPASQTCTETGRPTGLKANERTTLFTTGAERSPHASAETPCQARLERFGQVTLNLPAERVAKDVDLVLFSQ